MLCWVFFPLHAATITFKSGEVIKGKVVEETSDSIRVLDTEGYLQKYPKTEVKSIVEDEPEPPPASKTSPHDNDAQGISQKLPYLSTEGMDKEQVSKMKQEVQKIYERYFDEVQQLFDKSMDDFNEGMGTKSGSD